MFKYRGSGQDTIEVLVLRLGQKRARSPLTIGMPIERSASVTTSGRVDIRTVLALAEAINAEVHLQLYEYGVQVTRTSIAN